MAAPTLVVALLLARRGSRRAQLVWWRPVWVACGPSPRLGFAATGRLPDGVMPASGLHLVYTLDLALVVPSLALAGVLLWRQTAWGDVLGRR